MARIQEPEKILRTQRIMARMGFAGAPTGPMVRALWERVADQVDRGLVNRSAGTWAPGSENLHPEERARAMLEFDWAAERYGYEIKRLDGSLWEPRYFVAFLGDVVRSVPPKFRRWNDRRRGVRNPYAVEVDHESQ